MTTTTEQVRTQRFYCDGCREFHETPRLLDAVRAEAKRIQDDDDRIFDDAPAQQTRAEMIADMDHEQPRKDNEQ